jgi:hypothetical protein
MEDKTKKWLSERFGIPPEEIIMYNAGICYSRIVVTTQESAEKVREKVKDGTVNGGMLDGMPLGGISEYEQEGVITYSVYC